MSEETQETTTEAPEVTETTEQLQGTESAPESTEQQSYEFVMDKYRSDGRSEQEALELQAKSYVDLNSRFGSFTGAPESYEAMLSDELSEAGVELIADDPMIEGAMELAKDLNMNQEGFSKLVNMYGQMQLAEYQALEQQKADEMKALGSNSGQRIEGINKWVDANMDAETAEGLRSVINTAAGVKAVEQLIARTKTAPVAPQDAAPAPSITSADLSAMQFAKDEHGNRKMNDPAYRKEYEKKRDQLYGTGEHRQMVG